MLVNEEVPPWLNDIILAMVEKKPSLRPQSARHVGLTIEEEYQADRQQHTQRITVPSPEREEFSINNSADEIVEFDYMAPSASTSPLKNQNSNVQGNFTQNAGEDLLKSWSTKQEKLDAIDYLQSIGDAESIEFLIKAVERYHPDDIDLAPMTEWPKTGEIAARAARALGKSNRERAMNFLKDTLGNQEKPVTLREAASFGLAGSSVDAVLLSLRRAFLEEHGPFQRSILFALQESLQPLGRSKRDSVVQIILTLVEYATEHTETESNAQKELLEITRGIIKRHLSPRVEDQLLSIAINSNDLPKCIQSVSLLRKASTPKVHRGLAELLRDEVLPEDFSLAIGQTLKNSQNALVRKVATTTLSKVFSPHFLRVSTKKYECVGSLRK
jgi:HEAT repeat protein